MHTCNAICVFGDFSSAPLPHLLEEIGKWLTIGCWLVKMHITGLSIFFMLFTNTGTTYWRHYSTVYRSNSSWPCAIYLSDIRYICTCNTICPVFDSSIAIDYVNHSVYILWHQNATSHVHSFWLNTNTSSSCIELYADISSCLNSIDLKGL